MLTSDQDVHAKICNVHVDFCVCLSVLCILHVCVCVCVCVYLSIYACMYVCMYVCIYVCMYVCTPQVVRRNMLLRN